MKELSPRDVISTDSLPLVALDPDQAPDAEQLEAATAHWLRHTGATHDAQTRPLKHLSEDLGHSKIATTDQIYIQTNIKERAKSGVKRKI